MQTKHIKDSKPMLFTAGHDWHLDIFIEADAQISSVSLKAFSLLFPKNIYNIEYFAVLPKGDETQLPIDVSKVNHSIKEEMVHLDYAITYTLL